MPLHAGAGKKSDDDVRNIFPVGCKIVWIAVERFLQLAHIAAGGRFQEKENRFLFCG